MTLLRQLALVIAALFVLLFIGTIAISVNDTRDYLNVQLRTISQDTATSLGLSVSAPMANNDLATAESMVNAVFDSGYYREVALIGMDGKPLVSRVAPVKVEGVPSWFTSLVPLETPRGDALVMAGWQQAGHVRVAGNPGQAYLTLWKNSLNSFWWFFAASIVTSLLGMVALHFVLRPLRTVEAQAAAICDREYPVQARLPFTVELRSVVVAMNRMTKKIKEMFDEQTFAIERMRSESFRDGLTGLANRRFFDMRVRQMIESEEDALPSALLFIELKAFKSLNERLGYQAGDELLRAAAGAISEVCAGTSAGETIVAHFTGANFAVVLVDVTQSDAVDTGEKIAQALANLFGRGLVDTEEVSHIGITMHDGHSMPQLMADADMALRAAQVKGPNAVHIHEPKLDFERLAYPASQWTELLGAVIRERRFVLHAQPVLDAGDRNTVLQYETLLRIIGEDGKLIAAGVFLPMAKRLGLTAEFDKLVVGEVLDGIAAGKYGGSVVAVNLAQTAVHDVAFIDWLCEVLRTHAAAAGQIAFEVSEYGALDDLDALRSAVLRVRALGGKFGIDHFGRGFSSYGYLSTLKIDYLKIDGSYVRGLAASRENQFLVESLTTIAHGLDLKVIAESVENEEEWNALRALRVDGVQGYGVGMPREMSAPRLPGTGADARRPKIDA